MKCTRWAIAVAAVGALWTSPVLAQGVYPPSVNRTAFESYYSLADETPSPSDAPMAPPATGDTAPMSVDGAAPAGCGYDAGYGCDSGCGGGLFQCDPCCGLDCCDESAWSLFHCYNERNCHGISITGFIDQGFTWNPDNPPDRFNGPVTFNDRANEYQMNQAWLTMEKALEDDCCGWQWGGRVDAVYGTDARFTQAVGLEDHWGQTARFYQAALPQFYAEVGYNDLHVKAGHYFTIIGYEVVPATGNFFYSHAYTMQYGEPFTHTGALASYKFSDQWTVLGGVDQGWDIFQQTPSAANFLGGVNWTSANEKATLAFAISTGDNLSSATDELENGWIYSIVGSYKINECWTYVIQHDNGFLADGAQIGTGPVTDAQWYGINQYLFYRINCCWTAGVRAEWFRDDDGARVRGLGDGNAIADGGFAGNFYEITGGVNWKPNANWIVRPEVRWDWYSGPNNAAGQRPYDAGVDSSQFLAAVDLIFIF